MDDSLELINLLSGVATYIVGVGKGSWMIGHIRSSFLHLDLLGQMHPRFLMICTSRSCFWEGSVRHSSCVYVWRV